MKQYFFLLLTAFLFFSCKNSDNVLKPTTVKEQYITANTWEIKYFKLTNFKFGNFPTDIEYTKNQTKQPIFDFDKARITFKKDYTISAIGVSGNSVYSGKWNFLQNETKINILDSGLPGLDGETNLVKLTPDILILQGERRFTANDTTKSKLYLEMVPVL